MKETMNDYKKDWYKTKVGLFLGSFDPFHIGHLEATRKALTKGMDRVWIIPAPGNPWKEKKPVDLEIRTALIRTALFDWGLTKEDEKISVVSVPTSQREDGKYYSVDQLRKILREYNPEDYRFYIVGGNEITSEIKNWKEGDWILENFETLDIGRPGYGGTGGTEISSTRIRELVNSNFWGDLDKYLSPREIEIIRKYGLYAN